MAVHSIQLTKIKTSDVVALTYRRTAIQAKQTRLWGRYTLKPDISLDEFQTSAVIDWLDVTFEILANTQARWINDHLLNQVGHSISIRERKAEQFSRFTARFQQPRMKMVNECLSAIDAEYHLVASPNISGIEISIDFKPKIANDDARARMLAVLTRHLLPGRDVLTNELDRPRFSWGRGKEKSEVVLSDSCEDPVDYANLFTSGDNSPFVDATFYFGSEKYGCLWRIMDKVIDQQNIITGTKKVLTEEEKRVRVEVSLGEKEVRRLGITTMKDLRNFSFNKLQKEFFAFYLPTFALTDVISSTRQKVVKETRSQERIKKFLKTGVVGLSAMDEAWARQRSSKRKAMQSILKGRGVLMSRDRAGKGIHSTFTAYPELNKRIDTALRHLTEKVGGQ